MLTMTEVQRVRPVRPDGVTHAVFGPDGLVLTIALGQVPARSPYRPGDWVRQHGYPGALPGRQRQGWRGYVLGAMGSTLLHGVTDDGRSWCEHWGALQPDGTPCHDGGRCTCCPRGEMWRRVATRLTAPDRERYDQPALFDALSTLPALPITDDLLEVAR